VLIFSRTDAIHGARSIVSDGKDAVETPAMKPTTVCGLSWAFLFAAPLQQEVQFAWRFVPAGKAAGRNPARKPATASVAVVGFFIAVERASVRPLHSMTIQEPDLRSRVFPFTQLR